MSNITVKNEKILVIVPHEDDEINVAGSIMYRFIQQGYEVHYNGPVNSDQY